MKPKSRILVIEDTADTRRFLEVMLSKEFEVISAENGVIGVDYARNKAPDLILLDIIMPEMDGFELLEKINNEKLSPNSIKIILSNKSQQSDIDRSNNLGASGYIVKANSTPAEVINQVIAILNKKLVFPSNI